MNVGLIFVWFRKRVSCCHLTFILLAPSSVLAGVINCCFAHARGRSSYIQSGVPVDVFFLATIIIIDTSTDLRNLAFIIFVSTDLTAGSFRDSIRKCGISSSGFTPCKLRLFVCNWASNDASLVWY